MLSGNGVINGSSLSGDGLFINGVITFVGTVTEVRIETVGDCLCRGDRYGLGLAAVDAGVSAPTIASVSPNEGSTAGGTEITVAGSGFGPGTSATIGGASCTGVAVISETEFTCVAPAGTAGAADLVVTTLGGSVTSAGAFTYTTSTGAGGLVSVDPFRVIDTRGAGPVSGGEVFSVPLSAPPSAVGAVLNVTAVGSGVAGRGVSNDAALGFATVFPCDQPRPNASNLNYWTDEAVPNAVITGIGANGQVCVYVSETTDLLVDVMAWFTDGFTQVAPTRLLETRQPGGLPGRVAAGSVTRVRTTGIAGVPEGAEGVALNVTAVNAADAGFLSVYRCDATTPNTSSVNYAAGETVANLVVTGADAGGEVCVYSSAATDVLVDVFGWFTSVFEPVANTRLLDTRVTSGGVGPVAQGSVTRVRVAGAGPIPADARSVAATVTAVNAAAAGFMTVYPCDGVQPNTSNSNPTAGSTVANSVVMGLDGTGELCVYSSVATDLLVDIAGWFTTTVTN